ncbi:Hypothetical protein, putative [Bodo saltans]|uniref:Uncharacterized protein n=1 Tax=Bodo saltans TaxID=75058 RepID=A0A0S4J7V9_BODSA|nr:Hypothetical protein, putative [Bodo saltans]|eukprot:CUG84976.1 Hypothetical protein, putative [Bodo saltans]
MMRGALRLRDTNLRDVYPIYQNNAWLRKLLCPKKEWRAAKTPADGAGERGGSAATFKSMTAHISEDLEFPFVTVLELFTSLVVGACLGVNVSDRNTCMTLSVICVVTLTIASRILTDQEANVDAG